MKRHLYRLILLVCSVSFFTGCGYAGPEKAVRKELDQIQKLDRHTITSFLFYEDIPLTAAEDTGADSDAVRAMELFFQDFSYEIVASSQSKDHSSAAVDVQITNLDAELLAKDLCREMYRDTLIEKGQTRSDSDIQSSFSLLKDCLEANTYPSRTTSVTFHLTCEDDIWSIQSDDTLENELVGGLTDYLADPYLLAPEELLDLTLAPFCDFSAEDWQTYLNITDIFAVGTDQADPIDQLMFQQIADFFDYEITNVVQDGDTAQVTVQITSLDLNAIIETCLQPLQEYGSTTESIRASSEEFNQKTGEILLSALEANQQSCVSTVEIMLYNDGHTWDPILDASFTDALLGNVDEALASLHHAAE